VLTQYGQIRSFKRRNCPSPIATRWLTAFGLWRLHLKITYHHN